jgi:hypothetical protein
MPIVEAGGGFRLTGAGSRAVLALARDLPALAFPTPVIDLTTANYPTCYGPVPPVRPFFPFFLFFSQAPEIERVLATARNQKGAILPVFCLLTGIIAC